MNKNKKIIASALAGVVFVAYVGGNMFVNTKAEDELALFLKEELVAHDKINCKGWTFNPICTIENYTYENILTLHKLTVANTKSLAKIAKSPNGAIEIDHKAQGISINFNTPKAQEYVRLANLFLGQDVVANLQESLGYFTGEDAYLQIKGVIHVEDEKIIKAKNHLLSYGTSFFDLKSSIELENNEGFGENGFNGVHFLEIAFNLKDRKMLLDTIQKYTVLEQTPEEIIKDLVAMLERFKKDYKKDGPDWKMLDAISKVLLGDKSSIKLSIKGDINGPNNAFEDLINSIDIQNLVDKNYKVTVSNSF